MSGARGSAAGARPRIVAAARVRRPSRAERRRRRRRRLAGLVRFAVFVLIVFLAVWAGVRVAHAGDDGAIYTGERYVVQAGDSLWTIAESAYGHNADLRRAVHDIREANRLQGVTLQPGDVIMLPYEEAR